MRAERVGSDTLLAQIVNLVAQAQRSRPPIQGLADKVAGVFVPVVIAVAALTFVAWFWFGLHLRRRQRTTGAAPGSIGPGIRVPGWRKRRLPGTDGRRGVAVGRICAVGPGLGSDCRLRRSGPDPVADQFLLAGAGRRNPRGSTTLGPSIAV